MDAGTARHAKGAKSQICTGSSTMSQPENWMQALPAKKGLRCWRSRAEFLEGCNNGSVNARSIETHFHVKIGKPIAAPDSLRRFCFS